MHVSAIVNCYTFSSNEKEVNKIYMYNKIIFETFSKGRASRWYTAPAQGPKLMRLRLRPRSYGYNMSAKLCTFGCSSGPPGSSSSKEKMMRLRLRNICRECWSQNYQDTDSKILDYCINTLCAIRLMDGWNFDVLYCRNLGGFPQKREKIFNNS
jgi:hypothetical protein